MSSPVLRQMPGHPIATVCAGNPARGLRSDGRHMRGEAFDVSVILLGNEDIRRGHQQKQYGTAHGIPPGQGGHGAWPIEGR